MKQQKPNSILSVIELFTKAGLNETAAQNFYDNKEQAGWKYANGNPFNDWRTIAQMEITEQLKSNVNSVTTDNSVEMEITKYSNSIIEALLKKGVNVTETYQQTLMKELYKLWLKSKAHDDKLTFGVMKDKLKADMKLIGEHIFSWDDFPYVFSDYINGKNIMKDIKWQKVIFDHPKYNEIGCPTVDYIKEMIQLEYPHLPTDNSARYYAEGLYRVLYKRDFKDEKGNKVQYWSLYLPSLLTKYIKHEYKVKPAIK